MADAPNYYDLMRMYRDQGEPQHAAAIQRAIDAGEEPPKDLVNPKRIRPEVEVDSEESLEIPPRKGPGSSKKAWQEFAKQVSDIEPEIIDNMDQGEVIHMLEVRGVIPREED